MNSPIRTCYIAAPAGTNLKVVRRALSKRNIKVLVPDGSSAEGADLQGQISSLMSRVDLVIGVLTSERRSSWVLFELGLAWANKRPIMLLSSPKNDFIPSNLQRFLVLRALPTNAEAIEFALDQFLAAPLSDTQTSVPRRPDAIPADPAVWSTAQQAIGAIRSGDARLLEHLLAQALRQSGVEVVSEFATDDGRRADMAIWSDLLDPVIGNPLLVEVKLRLRSTSEARNAAHALAKHLSASGTRWGLLLYGEGSALTANSPGWLPPNILAIDLPTLFDRMRVQSFSDVVKDLRNQKVHGSHP